MKATRSGAACLLLTELYVLMPASRAESVSRHGQVVVSYDEISKPYADAIARTVEAARAAAVRKYGFDMPRTVTVRVRAELTGGARLYNDGDSTLSLTVRAEKGLRKPADSGVFVIYGLCHEVGHLAMYRLIRERGWMTTAAAEGWAHYLGSRLVDDVQACEGAALWPDRYDYAEDGMKRLRRQLTDGGASSPVVRGAGLWRDLVEMVGDRGTRPIFAAWGKASVDPAEPSRALGGALGDDKKLRAWWSGASAAFVVRRPASGFAVRTAKKAELDGKPRELASDDGKAVGKRSIAGGGHAVRLEAPGDAWYLTSVRVHGSRYGPADASKDKFTVHLCDERFKRISTFTFPYSAFKQGRPECVTLDVAPTNVPAKFVLCVEFNPTARKGVFVFHDKGRDGASFTGLPGEKGRPFVGGDWMIRAVVDQLGHADAL
jgi:RNA polymerase sigma-70 factor (ECF subfamily)